MTIVTWLGDFPLAAKLSITLWVMISLIWFLIAHTTTIKYKESQKDIQSLLRRNNREINT